MTTATDRQRKPAITIAASEHEKLTRLAEQGGNQRAARERKAA